MTRQASDEIVLLRQAEKMYRRHAETTDDGLIALGYSQLADEIADRIARLSRTSRVVRAHLSVPLLPHHR
jgi:hypothetical protein